METNGKQNTDNINDIGNSKSTRSYSTFRLDGKLFGIDILFVREINRQLEMTAVQHAPEFIQGLVNLRGQIVTVMDLSRRIGRMAQNITTESHNMIIKTNSELLPIQEREDRPDLVSSNDMVGLLVESIGDVVTVKANEISSPPANIGAFDGEYFSGVVKLDDDLMAVVDVQKVLAVAGSKN
ncbi:MAG: chemotaxis protein CheW [Vampirovibrio sp.]|nr:chemotaxis protein CheW [Vampirovibrio sp.]